MGCDDYLGQAVMHNAIRYAASFQKIAVTAGMLWSCDADIIYGYTSLEISLDYHSRVCNATPKPG